MAIDMSHIEPAQYLEIQGMKYRILEIADDVYPAVVCEGWQDRHPDIPWHERFNYPDAIKWGGKLIPRVKKARDITFQDLVDAGVHYQRYARSILACDHRLRDAIPDQR